MSFLLAILLGLYQSLPHDQWRLVEKDGTVQPAMGPPVLGADGRSQVVAAWTWSDRRGPRRIEAAHIGPDAATGESGRLAVRVARQGRAKPAADLRLLAAPQAMWMEVPESSLPSWPIPRDGKLSLPIEADGRPWRLRLAGKGEGSWWVDAGPGERSVTVAPQRAGDVDVTVLDSQGKPAHDLLGSVQEPAGRGGTFRPWERAPIDGGKIHIAGLPDAAEVSLTVLQAEAAPLFLRGRPSTLPHEVRLSRGQVLSGRIVDGHGRPVANAEVAVESFATESLPQVVSRHTRTDGRGAWRARGLPAGQVAWKVTQTGFVPLAETFLLADGTPGDVGTHTLLAGRSFAIQVVDDAGAPVPGAKVDLTCGVLQEATADGRGMASFSGVPLAPFKLAATAPRHLLGRASIGPPYPERPEVVVPRAFTVQGRFVDASGRPVARGWVQVASGNTRDRKPLGEEGGAGGFVLDVPPGASGIDLLLTSAETPELKRNLPSGAAGEVRDLGDLRAPAGLSAVGRVVRADDGTPLAGARIWTTRQGPLGPAIAWATRDLLSSTTDADGRFRLSGLLPVPATLRVEATGLALAQIALPLGGGSGDAGAAASEIPQMPEIPEIDLGTLALGAGTNLHVRVDAAAPGAEGALARADVGNRWLEQDFLSTQVWNGEALLANVPAGKVTVSVLAGRRLLCEQVVEVGDGGDQDVDCRRPALLVNGSVQVGGVPVNGGTLLWQAPPGDIPGNVVTTALPSGLRQTQITGIGRPPVQVAVGPDGSFATDELIPGEWQVSYEAEGSLTPALPVTLPGVERFTAVLPFAGLAVTGSVADREGKPVEGARVRELTRGSFAWTDREGRFTLTGISPGVGASRKPVVQAQKEEETSAAVEVALEAGRPPSPVHLVLGTHEAPSLEVQVVDAAGAPAGNAFVFLEEEGKGRRILTAGADGKAAASLEAPLPAQLRAAAYAGGAWGFGAWTTREAAAGGLVVSVEGAGTLTVTSARLAGSPKVTTEGGWDLSWLLRLLGAPPAISAREPLRLSGLPNGRYEVQLESSAASVTIAGGRSVEGELR